MKKQFLVYLQNELKTKNELISKNTISEEDKQTLQGTIDELTAMIAEVEALEDEVDVTEVLNDFKVKIDEKILALSEKLEDKTENKMIETTTYLESKNAMKDFFKAVKESKNSVEFNSAWNAKLSENGITATDDEALLPAALRGAIMDAWERPSNFLKDLKNTGAKRYMVRTADGEGEGIRAKGHKKGERKTAQNLTITPKDVKAQMVYKLLPVSAIDEFNDEGDLIAYVVDELNRQWLVEVQRCILVGDGREASDVNKINSIEAIGRDTTDAYVTVNTFDAETSLMEQVVNMVATINDVNNDGIVLFMSKEDLNSLRKVVVAEGGTPQYIGKDVVAEMIGVKDIYTTSMLGEDYKAIAFVPRGYVTVGFTQPDLYSWIDGYMNETVYRMERPVGGAVEAPKSAAVLHA